MTKQHFFKDINGHIVIWQRPNIPLAGWIVAKILSFFITSGPLTLVGKGFLFAWAILELVDGVNYFRRLLGLVILISLFR